PPSAAAGLLRGHRGSSPGRRPALRVEVADGLAAPHARPRALGPSPRARPARSRLRLAADSSGHERSRPMKILRGICLAVLLRGIALAQGPGGGDDPFAAYLYPPERVMGHSLEIGLDDAQKTAIKNEVMKVQGRFTELQFELQGE